MKPAWSWQFDPATLQPVCGVAADSDHLGERLTGRGIVLAGGMRRALTCGMQVLNMSLST